jgi:pSer/pThr/pTyr-binding forkhead associated (FHA) protein
MSTDPRFQSLHLEGLPRRELFRSARTALEAACGTMTLAGDLRILEPAEPPGGETLSAPPGAATQFYVRDGDTLHPLALGVNSIGRLPDNNVVIKDEHVSRRHCAVVIHCDGRCEVHDIASKNGTVLNGKKINGPTKLRPGDQITLCTRKLTFVAEYGTPQSSPKPAAD